jgi:hypothetical protein
MAAKPEEGVVFSLISGSAVHVVLCYILTLVEIRIYRSLLYFNCQYLNVLS